jgi:hypothetical protein
VYCTMGSSCRDRPLLGLLRKALGFLSGHFPRLAKRYCGTIEGNTPRALAARRRARQTPLKIIILTDVDDDVDTGQSAASSDLDQQECSPCKRRMQRAMT